MIRPHAVWLAGLLVATSLVTGPLPLAAQQPAPPPSTAPSPAQTSPLPTTTTPNPPQDTGKSAAPAPQQAVTSPVPAQAGAATSVPPPDVSRDKTLVETPGEAGDVDAVSLPPKPAAILAGKAKWEEAAATLKGAFARIEADLAKAGIRPAGRPIAVFTGTDDDGFQYEAMIPLAAMPEAKPALGDALRFGTTPSGKALRFPHKGSYEGIDGTYETLTAYLDAKDIVVQDRFIEEYVTDLKDGADEQVDVNIYALVK